MEELLHVPLPIWGLSGYRALARQCAWADVVHAHDCLYPSSAAALLFAWSVGKPLLLTQHIGSVPYGAALNMVQELAYRSMGRAVLEGATKVVAYSAHVPQYFRGLGVNRPIELVPLGFDDRFQPGVRSQRSRWREKFGVPADGPVVLFVGRLVPKKGVADIVAAHRALAQRGYTLVVAGNGALSHLLEKLPRVVHIPSVSYIDMHEVYGLADVLFLPSRGEGLPLTLQEALLCGLPAVVSRDPSYVENVSGAPGVAMCEGHDAWIAALHRAVEAPALPEQIAGWASVHFARSSFLDGYDAIYREILSSPNRAARNATVSTTDGSAAMPLVSKL
jgi:glycosyltransferase involved in cell wall biosynthesis